MIRNFRLLRHKRCGCCGCGAPDMNADPLEPGAEIHEIIEALTGNIQNPSAPDSREKCLARILVLLIDMEEGCVNIDALNGATLKALEPVIQMLPDILSEPGCTKGAANISHNLVMLLANTGKLDTVSPRPPLFRAFLKLAQETDSPQIAQRSVTTLCTLYSHYSSELELDTELISELFLLYGTQLELALGESTEPEARTNALSLLHHFWSCSKTASTLISKHGSCTSTTLLRIQEMVYAHSDEEESIDSCLTLMTDMLTHMDPKSEDYSLAQTDLIPKLLSLASRHLTVSAEKTDVLSIYGMDTLVQLFKTLPNESCTIDPEMMRGVVELLSSRIQNPKEKTIDEDDLFVLTHLLVRDPSLLEHSRLTTRDLLDYVGIAIDNKTNLVQLQFISALAWVHATKAQQEFISELCMELSETDLITWCHLTQSPPEEIPAHIGTCSKNWEIILRFIKLLIDSKKLEGTHEDT